MPRDIITIRRRGGYFATPQAAVVPPMSLVLVAASSQYLTRTWSATPTNGFIGTLAFFLKRSSVQSAQVYPYDGGDYLANAGSTCDVRFNTGDGIEQLLYNGSSVTYLVPSSSSYTDTTIWHHFVIAVDTTQATAANRIHIYADGTEVAYASPAYPTINQPIHFADNTVQSAIGRYNAGASGYLDAKLAFYYYIDGQQLTPSAFTTGTGAGTTHPATYTGTYGTNGFFLNFGNSNTNDQSGNANNWTQNNSPTFSSDIPT